MINTPPKLAKQLLLRFLRDDLAEEVLGDLDEKFNSTLRNRSLFPAQLNYWYQVLNYLRPFAIRKSKTANSNFYAMFQHNILISFRNFKKFKSSFLINLAGLSTGLACALLIYLWVNDELSVDKFHKNDSRLYQVMKTYPRSDGTVTTMSYTPSHMAKAMAEELPEVQYAASVLSRPGKSIVSVGDKYIKAQHRFASEDYFKVFSYELIQGNEETALKDKYGVLLSEELALKLFNTTENIVGKMVEWEWWDKFNGAYAVSGVFAMPPANSSAEFDIIFSHSLWIEKNNDNCWCSNNADTYLILKEGTDVKEFNDKIRDYSKAKLTQLEGPGGLKWEGTLSIQRYSDRYLYDHYENGVQAGGKIEYVKLFSIIGLAILVIACINFMNLSTAKASRRVKEVGIKKVVGAQRGALITQYIGESMIMTILSFVIAILVVYLLLPSFNEVTGKDIALNFDKDLLLSMAGITLITGIISGSYPALYLSGFRPALVLKGQLKTSAGESWVRKGLVVFQFAVSVILIVSVLVVYKQIEFIRLKNLGYDKENLIRFLNDGKLRRGAPTFVAEVKKMPGVVNASTMSGDMVGNHSGGGGIEWEGKTQGIEFSGLYVDYDLLETLGLKIVAGRTFSPEFGSDRDKVIFNETAISMMGLKDPIGTTVTMWGAEKQIIGVVKDFHYESLYEDVGPFFFACTEHNNSTLVKLKAGMERETLDQISKFYKEYTGGLPFDYEFMDQDYQTLYAAENRVSILSRYFAGVAILISCLGLFGLAAFTAERRTKEIGIRKVLGSSALRIVYLLTSDFTKIVFVSIFIALPLSYFLTQQWLKSFAFRIELEWWYFTCAALVTLLIAWFTVGIQTVKAANINPTQCLKNE
ncbi:MAG: ABC transporter permease [Cyclobacteriaceae bacterium]